MLLGNEKLKKVTDGIFQVPRSDDDDDKKPLEWRRGFNFIKLPLKNIKIIYSFNVHDVEFRIDEEKEEHPEKLLKPDIKSSIGITALLDENKIDDSIYIAVENKDEKGIFTTAQPKGETRITLKSGTPTKESEERGIPEGLYWGNAFWMHYDPGEDNVCFELSIPLDQMNNLVAALRADENSKINIGVQLLSFTYEVDDFLREHYHPRNIIINDITRCYVSWVELLSSVGQQYIKSDGKIDEDIVKDVDLELTPEQQSHKEFLNVFLSYVKPLNSLKTAAWFLVVVITLHALFSK